MAQIYAVQRKHYEELAIFLSNFENTTKNEDLDFWSSRFSLWWDNNPAFSEDLLRGLILDSDGHIEGFIGLIPSFFQLSGDQIKVFSSTTLRVSEKSRGMSSLKLTFQLIDYAKESIYFSTSSSGRIAGMQKGFRLKTIFSEERLRTYYAIIDPWKIFCAVPPKSLFLRFVLALFYPIMLIYHFMIKLKIQMAHEFYETRIVEKADSGFDELWESTKTRFKNTNVRTSEVINWYCSNNGMGRNILFGCYLKNRLMGYVLCMSEGEHTRVKRLTVVDIWGQLDDDQVVNSLLNKCLKYGVTGNYALVLFPVFSETIKSFSRNFILNRLSPGSYFFTARPEVLGQIAEESTYFTYLQGDWGLY